MRALSLLTLCVLAACRRDPVAWTGEKRVNAVVAPGAQLLLQADGRPAMTSAWIPPAMPAGAPICAGSIVAARGRGDTAFAAWWSPRADSSAQLLVARVTDLRFQWEAPVVADSAERVRAGCRRPPPAIYADLMTGTVYVTYYLHAPEGPGVFLTHSMPPSLLFHAPVPIVYGERPSMSSVAARGDTVAVAYEEPNRATAQLWLALSRTGGHIFEDRMSVSSPNSAATLPGVAMRDGRIAVAWFEPGQGLTRGTAVARVGVLQW